jgi:hypothetical protein
MAIPESRIIKTLLLLLLERFQLFFSLVPVPLIKISAGNLLNFEPVLKRIVFHLIKGLK